MCLANITFDQFSNRRLAKFKFSGLCRGKDGEKKEEKEKDKKKKKKKDRSKDKKKSKIIYYPKYVERN